MGAASDPGVGRIRSGGSVWVASRVDDVGREAVEVVEPLRFLRDGIGVGPAAICSGMRSRLSAFFEGRGASEAEERGFDSRNRTAGLVEAMEVAAVGVKTLGCSAVPSAAGALSAELRECRCASLGAVPVMAIVFPCFATAEEAERITTVGSEESGSSATFARWEIGAVFAAAGNLDPGSGAGAAASLLVCFEEDAGGGAEARAALEPALEALPFVPGAGAGLTVGLEAWAVLGDGGNFGSELPLTGGKGETLAKRAAAPAGGGPNTGVGTWGPARIGGGAAGKVLMGALTMRLPRAHIRCAAMNSLGV